MQPLNAYYVPQWGAVEAAGSAFRPGSSPVQSVTLGGWLPCPEPGSSVVSECKKAKRLVDAFMLVLCQGLVFCNPLSDLTM